LARPVKRPAPSPRVWAAIAAAAIVGAVTFVIWWSTSPSTPKPVERSTAPAPRVDFALPRGGSLTGSLPVDVDAQQAIALLTGAPLFRVNRSSDEVEPWLAESSVSSTDNLVYTIKLRAHVMRADGAALMAEDVLSSFKLHPPTIAEKPVTVSAIDPQTIELTFPSPFAPALRVLDAIPIAGYGPFVMTEQAASGRLTFARNPHYWRQAPDGKPLPYLDGLILEGSAARPDQLDFNENLRPSDYRSLRQADDAGKLRLYDLGPGLDADAMWMNLTSSAGAKSWLRSDVFRQAISTAIDRRAYCDTVFAGMCDPIAGPVTPGSGAWFMPDLLFGHDPALARATLAGLGLLDRNSDGVLDDDHGRPVRFTLLVPRGRDTVVHGAVYLRDELKKVGIAVDVMTLDPSILQGRWQKGDYDAIYDRTPMRDGDPAMNLDFWLSSGSRHMWNPRQSKPSTEWEAQIDRLMAKQSSTFDRVERVQSFAEAQRAFAEHMPAIYFGAPYMYVATSMRVLNARPVRQRPALLWNAETLAAAR
jgi:peptide/nickel transport system substrate-binding protein